MKRLWLKGLLAGVCFAAINSADAQQAYLPTSTPSYRPATYGQDTELLRQGLAAARSGNIEGARSLRDSMSDPIAKKIVTWAMIDVAAEKMAFFELDRARTDLWGWPREVRRQAAAEKLLETAALPPAQVVAWFKGADPATAEGAMALSVAYQATGQGEKARQLIRRFWRDVVFEADVQSRMLSRFGGMLGADDHAARADMLLYGSQGPATAAMVAMLPADLQTAARARMALRGGGPNANALYGSLPPNLQQSPGVAFERAKYLRTHGLDVMGIQLAKYFPRTLQNDTVAKAVWAERKQLIGTALKNGDYRAAYDAASNSGLPVGADLAEAEFFAGWLALAKLNQPQVAMRHFVRVGEAGTSPITQGRAAEASGDQAAAQRFYALGARHQTVFYGQLAAEKAGIHEIVLGKDPIPSPEDKARFENRELVRAARLLYQAGESDLFKAFMLAVDDTLPNAEEYVLAVDLTRGLGEQFLSMQIVRVGAQRGFILPERGYPTTYSGRNPTGPEPAFVHGIIRQESSFDPKIRSGAGATGMMQLMPATAQTTARQIGESYSSYLLTDPAFNVKVGSAYLGQMIDNFGGSYVMAAAAYNAGPGRPPQWAAQCGDPRGTTADPLNFIECIPFSETRNYVMRVLENTQVYRARLAGGRAPLTLASDIKRGSYVYRPPATYTAETTIPRTPQPGAATMAPIPDQ
ncbi:MAG: lytic transglycosylase domain-containing protein [Caulobacteraceae bacterium]